ncbi:MAG: DinB family protein [Gammaproteobacteria bacterium]|nr:DinB family protein [Gammaproteobacteria bacterium]
MSEKTQLILMASYNRLMNQRLLQASACLTEESLRQDKAAFFKSVFATFNHIMVGDILWLKRFALHPSYCASLKPLMSMKKPERLDQILYRSLPAFKKQREKLDTLIIDWCHEIDEQHLDCALSYVDVKGNVHNKRLGDLILHVFLHQVHHRGQVTTLLSQEAVDFGETDLPEIVPEMA